MARRARTRYTPLGTTSPRSLGDASTRCPLYLGLISGHLGCISGASAGEHSAAFEANGLQGDVIFLLLESHLQDMGISRIGDRLYFMEELTQAPCSNPLTSHHHRAIADAPGAFGAGSFT